MEYPSSSNNSVKILGKGAYGEATTDTDETPAIVRKSIPKCFGFSFKKELESLMRLRHPNIVSCYGNDPDTEEHHVLRIEYCERGALRGIIDDPTMIYKIQAVFHWGEHLMQALIYLKSESIVHRDINPLNILVCLNFVLKLADFGISKELEDVNDCESSVLGCFRYLSPETHKKESISTYESDLYAVGLVMWELVERQTVFGEYGPASHCKFEDDLFYEKITLERPECNNELQDLIMCCANVDPDARGNAQAALTILQKLRLSTKLIDWIPTIRESHTSLLRPTDYNDSSDEVVVPRANTISLTLSAMEARNFPESSPFDISLDDFAIKSTPQFSDEPPTAQRRIFVKARTLFVKPITKDGRQDFEEVMGDIELPEEYKPDTNDRFYRPPKLSEDKDVYHVIASGNFADIIAAVNRDGKPVAAKRYKIEKLNQTIDGYTRLRREIQISCFNRHENIVEFHGVFMENLTHVWLVTERMDHTLEKYFEHLRRKDETSEPVKRDLFQIGALLTQLLRALGYIHQHEILHGNVTPQNIGISQKGFKIKLLGFGLSKETNSKSCHSTNFKIPYNYKSLQVFMRTKYNTGVDISAAALVALEMLGTKLFMPTGNDVEITRKIRKRGAENAVTNRIFTVLGVPDDQYLSIFDRPVQEKPHPGEFDKIWEEKIEQRLDKDIGPLRNLIKKMLHPNPQQRLRADECFLHPFLHILNINHLLGNVELLPDPQMLDPLEREFFLTEPSNHLFFGYESDSKTERQDPFFTVPYF